MNVKGSPSGQFPPLSTRNQQRGSPSSLTRYSNDSSPLNKGRVQGFVSFFRLVRERKRERCSRSFRNRIFHEPLKDHSDESHYPYPPLYSDPFSRSPYDNGQRGQQDPLSLLKIFLIIFGLIIALFSLTALAISIYLLVKLSNSGNIT